MTEHGIKLVDDIPVKEANRRIPQGMYEEVRLDIGVIRKSSMILRGLP